MPFLLSGYEVAPIDSWADVVAIGDVTGDFVGDIVVVTTTGWDPGTHDHAVLVYPGGRFDLTPYVVPLGIEIHSPGLALGDLNGDLVNEILVGHADGLAVLAGGVNGQVGSPVHHDDEDDFHLEDNSAVVVSDVDLDGNLDVVGVPNLFDIMIYFGDGAGGFSRIGRMEHSAYGHTDPAVGDVNSDGFDDLVIVPGLSDHGFGVHLHDGKTGWSEDVEYWDLPDSVFADSAEIVDFDGDGANDVIVSDHLNHCAWVYVQEADGFAAPIALVPPEEIFVGGPGAITSADVDLDGDLDLFFTLDPDDYVGFYAVGGTQGMQITPIEGALGHHGQGIAAGDATGDGCVDVALVSGDSGLVRVRGICGVGDADSDGVPDDIDPCPGYPDGMSSDGDGDGVGDACDCAPADAALPNEQGACPVGPPPPGGPTSGGCQTAPAAAWLALAAVALIRRARRTPAC